MRVGARLGVRVGVGVGVMVRLRFGPGVGVGVRVRVRASPDFWRLLKNNLETVRLSSTELVRVRVSLICSPY